MDPDKEEYIEEMRQRFNNLRQTPVTPDWEAYQQSIIERIIGTEEMDLTDEDLIHHQEEPDNAAEEELHLHSNTLDETSEEG